MKKRYFLAVAATLLLSMSSCSDFLDQEPDSILKETDIYNDPNLLKSVIANFYGHIGATKKEKHKDDLLHWGQRLDGDMYHYTLLDEAIRFDFDNINGFERNRWRVYDYEFVRELNVFIDGIRKISTLPEDQKTLWVAEVRLIRTWYYFVMCRGLGGMPIVGDELFEYTPGMNIAPMQKPRATEAEMYDYIISECADISNILSAGKTKNSARANKWTAKMLESRAALYAASLAKYNSQMVAPLHTSGGEVGIDASKAQGYYQRALATAEEVINSGIYLLQDRRPDDRARNFYEAICVKDNNTEVIWARDYIYPGQTHSFTRRTLPSVSAQDADCSYLSVLLNLAEEFEPLDTPTPGQGSPFDIGRIEDGSIKFFNTADELFQNRDYRLGGTVIYPGAYFGSQEIVLQAGQMNWKNGRWEKLEGNPSDKDDAGQLITSQNGPVNNYTLRLVNKTGLTIRKFLDEAAEAGTHGRGSEMWEPYFRISEAYLIASEALFELNGGNDAEALRYMNAVRNRAGVKPLTTITFDNLVHERRVEFAFEDHRFWDVKRWRIADKLWTGNQAHNSANRRGLWPYRIVASGDTNDGKWVFEEKNMNFIYPYALRFEFKDYYSELDNIWLNNNPKLVKNPYQ